MEAAGLSVSVFVLAKLFDINSHGYIFLGQCYAKYFKTSQIELYLSLLEEVCTPASLSRSSHRNLQPINERRLAIGHLVEVPDQDSDRWETAHDNKILQQDLRGAQILTGKNCVSLYQWEYPGTVKTWRSSSPSPVPKQNAQQRNPSSKSTSKMLATITISGHGACFEAMTCEQYVYKRWGGVGIQVATFLAKAAELVSTTDVSSETEAQGQTVKLVIKLDDIRNYTGEVFAYAFPSYVCLFVRGLDDPQVQEVQEIAQWMCQTFRPVPSKPNELSALWISRFTQSTDLCSQVDYEAKVFRLLPLEPLEIHRAGCWTALFETGIVAETPYLRNPELEGIEMSFDLMTNLAAVETYHYPQHSDIAGGLILLGFFTALVPVCIHQSGVIQWHFEYSENDIIRPMDLKSTQEPWAYVNSPSELFGRRCVIGIWPQANIMLGVQGTRLDFEDSGLPHRSSVLRPKGFELTAGLGSSGGPVQGIMQGTKTYEHTNTRQRFKRANAYVTALNHLSQAVSLVYDCKTHTGWLVP